MSLANKIIAIFMILLAIETVKEYFFYWESFEKKFESKFQG